MPGLIFSYKEFEFAANAGGDVRFAIRENGNPGSNDTIFLAVPPNDVQGVRMARTQALECLLDSEKSGYIRVRVTPDESGDLIENDSGTNVVDGIDVQTCLLLQIFVIAISEPIPGLGHASGGDFVECGPNDSQFD